MKELFSIIPNADGENSAAFLHLADQLMNGFQLVVNAQQYRIVECECYFHHAGHADPFVHGHELQKTTTGAWYFHPSGLDITLALDNGAYGGILIRSLLPILDAPDVKQEIASAIIGPLNVCTELFRAIGTVAFQPGVPFGLRAVSDEHRSNHPQARIFCLPRIGLNHTKGEEFATRPYRYVSHLHLRHKQRDFIKKYLTESTRILTAEEYKQHYNGQKI